MITLLERLQNITGEFLETSDHVKAFIKEKGVATGSQRWGVATEDSDFDIILPPQEKYTSLSVGNIICNHNGRYLHKDEEAGIPHYREEEFDSCYVLVDGSIFNLILTRNMETFNVMTKATYIMDLILENDPLFKDRIKDKTFRVDFFERVKEALK